MAAPNLVAAVEANPLPASHKADTELVKAQKQRKKSQIGFDVRRSKPAWSRECESLTGKEQRSILTPSLAWCAAR